MDSKRNQTAEILELIDTIAQMNITESENIASKHCRTYNFSGVNKFSLKQILIFDPKQFITNTGKWKFLCLT